MSGPLTAVDATPDTAPDPVAQADDHATVEVVAGREAMVGALSVHRVLPRRPRRMVGAWCFADHMGPTAVTEGHGIDIGPHPHTGLHTVTWLLAGEVLHRDSLGSEVVIRPDQLNLMTAGHGVAHSEEATGSYRGDLHGVQLWVAQPDETRHGAAAFEHHAELPQVESANAVATVLVGELAGARSSARADTPLVGADLALRRGTSSWAVQPAYEHAVIVLDTAVRIAGRQLVPGELAYLGTGRTELILDADEPARVLLLGGQPFGEPVFMWWNFVARTRAEAAAAARAWNDQDDRFGHVDSPLARIPAPEPA